MIVVYIDNTVLQELPDSNALCHMYIVINLYRRTRATAVSMLRILLEISLFTYYLYVVNDEWLWNLNP